MRNAIILIGTCLFASSVFAGSNTCPNPACGPGSCLSLKAVAINGIPIAPTNNVAVARGDRIETEIWLSCWGSDVGLLRGYQAVIKGSIGVTSGDAGLVLPVGWDAPLDLIACVSDFSCPPGTACSSGKCSGPNHFPTIGFFLDQNLLDYVLGGFDVLPFVGTTTLDYIIGGTSRDITGAIDTGESKYGGTLLLDVSDDACGVFTFDFATAGPSLVSVFAPPSNLFSVVPGTQPLFIQTLDCDCNNNGILDDDELANCNGDSACGDCNQNGILDSCDIASGTSPDIDNNGTPDDCFIPIPTVSEWGLAVLTLLLLVAAKLKFGFDRSRAA